MTTEIKPTEHRSPPQPNRRPRTAGAGKTALWMTVGGAIGAGLGFAYYYFVGCESGHCLIGANPFLSLLFGGLFGLSAAAMMASPAP